MLNLRLPQHGRPRGVKQTDLSFQWPLTRRLDRRGPLELVASGTSARWKPSPASSTTRGCWVFRAVGHRFSHGADSGQPRFLVPARIERLSRIGSNPVDAPAQRRRVTRLTRAPRDDATDAAERCRPACRSTQAYLRCLARHCCSLRCLRRPAACRSRCGASRAAVLVDRIVAVVNDEVITARELDERAALAVERQLRRQGTRAPPRALLERQLLERMIGDRRSCSSRKDSGVRVDDAAARPRDRSASPSRTSSRWPSSAARSSATACRSQASARTSATRSHVAAARARGREQDRDHRKRDRPVPRRARRRGDAQRRVQPLAHPGRVPENASPEQVQAARARRGGAGAARRRRRFRQVAAAFPKRPTRCRAAPWAGARASACRRSSSTR